MTYTKEYLEILVKDSNSLSEVTKKAGLNEKYCGNRQTIKKYLNEYNIRLDHFGNYKTNRSNKKIELSLILIKNSSYSNTVKLKEKLYKEGLKQRRCELCSQGEEWMGKKMSLILDHKNGTHNDNRIENLRIVCPNCNATLDTHGGKNRNKRLISEMV